MQLFYTYKILNKLLSNEKVLARDLAQELETSPRTIYRYINSLICSGVPINAKIGRNGGLEIDKSYKLDKSFLTKAEIDFLNKTLTSLALGGNIIAEGLLNKFNLIKTA